MLDTVTPATAVAQFGTVLQSQGDAAAEIQNNALLSSSFWVNVALAGFAVLLFVYMGRNVQSSRARLIWVATLLVPLVSLSSYASLVSGLTVGFAEMPAGHPLANEEVLSTWGRYLTWTFSTPAILAALGLLAGTDFTKLFTAIAMDVAMCVTGLAAALVTSSLLFRWVFFGISTAFFLVVVYILLFEWPDDAAAAGTADIFGTLRNLTVVLWFGYPIAWALGVEGLALLSVGVTSWVYSGLDILAKYAFAFLLLRWVADNEDVVATNPALFGDSGGTAGGGATPADD